MGCLCSLIVLIAGHFIIFASNKKYQLNLLISDVCFLIVPILIIAVSLLRTCFVLIVWNENNTKFLIISHPQHVVNSNDSSKADKCSRPRIRWDFSDVRFWMAWTGLTFLLTSMRFSISSPEPKAHLWAYRIGKPPSSVVCRLSVRRPHSLDISSETAWPIKVKFHLEPPWDGERKFVQTMQVTWPRWPPCPYKVKNWNQRADDLETCYAASGAWVLPSFFKWCPWVGLDLFYGKVKFGPLCFCIGRR